MTQLLANQAVDRLDKLLHIHQFDGFRVSVRGELTHVGNDL